MMDKRQMLRTCWIKSLNGISWVLKHLLQIIIVFAIAAFIVTRPSPAEKQAQLEEDKKLTLATVEDVTAHAPALFDEMGFVMYGKDGFCVKGDRVLVWFYVTRKDGKTDTLYRLYVTKDEFGIYQPWETTPEQNWGLDD
jgi:hypothetical protein